MSNQLVGGIPRGINAAHLLQEIRLDNNNMSGNLPPSVGLLTQLTIFSVRHNRFSGSIPNTFASVYAPEVTRQCDTTNEFLLRDAAWCLDVELKLLTVIDVCWYSTR
jgi:hypothetical protein